MPTQITINLPIEPGTETCEVCAVEERMLGEIDTIRKELATLREAARIRVTAEEPPTNLGAPLYSVLAYRPHGWTVLLAVIVAREPKMYTHWAPLPERPAK